jgi:hydroxymethylbilane synthase
MTRTLRIGTRGSALALVQANWVAVRLGERGVPTEIVIIRTEGDDRPIDTAWGEGAFVGRILAALLDGSVDLAVHSAKDVPTDEHPALVIAAYPPREDPRDALVCRVRGTTLATLPHGARVGTDSPRRTAFLLHLRPDLVLHPLHGNVDTRLAKLDRGDSDALVLAVAGLTRLGRADRIDDVLASDLVASAPGQGSLALQVRADDAEAQSAVGRLDDPATRIAVEAERALLNGTGGGCRSPIGVIGRVLDGQLTLAAGAGREWVRAAGPHAAIPLATVGWVLGTTPVAAHRALAARMAARVVALRERPRVLVARPADHADALLGALIGAGIETVHVPAIEVIPAEPGGDLDRVLASSGEGTLVVVASANAAGVTLDAMGRLARVPSDVKWAAVGEATAAVLREAGVAEVFVPSVASGAALAAELPLAPGDRVLLPRADIADASLPDALQQRGAVVTEVAAYQTREAPDASRSLLADALADGPLDLLVLTSGSGARGLAALATAGDRARLLATPVVASGAKAAEIASSVGYRTVLIAPAPDSATLASFAAASLGVAAGSVPDTEPSFPGGVR